MSSPSFHTGTELTSPLSYSCSNESMIQPRPHLQQTSHQVRNLRGRRSFNIALYEEIISAQNASKSMKIFQKMLEVMLKNKVARFFMGHGVYMYV